MTIIEKVAAVLWTYDVVGKSGFGPDLEWFVCRADNLAVSLAAAAPGTGRLDYAVARQDALEANARCAIEAMREPTEAMVTDGGWEDGDATARAVWHAMIDAALKNKA